MNMVFFAPPCNNTAANAGLGQLRAFPIVRRYTETSGSEPETLCWNVTASSGSLQATEWALVWGAEADLFYSRAITRLPFPLIEIKESDNTSVVLSRIAALLQESEDYDADFLKPEDSAVTAALTMVREVSGRIGNAFPRGAATPDGEGGLRLRFKIGSKEVRVTFPKGDPYGGYVFRTDGVNGYVEEPVTASALTAALQWGLLG